MKLINKLTVTCPLFVLIFGLISCSPEQPQKDNFSIQEPEVITDKNRSVKLASLEPGLIWNTEDRIQFKEEDRAGLQLQVKASCRSIATNEVYEETQFKAYPRELLIGDILPLSLLARKNPATSKQFQCSFAFAASNSNGSQHRFQIQARTLEEPPHTSRNTSLKINGSIVETKPGEWPLLKSNEFEKYWFMSPRADQFRLSCNDLKTKIKTKTDVISLTEILKTVSAEKLQLSIQRAPEQTCRVLAFQNDVLQGWSTYFKIQWPDSKLEMQHTRILPPAYWIDGLFSHTYGIYEVRIKNPNPFPVYFSLPQQTQVSVLNMFTNRDGMQMKTPLIFSFDKTAAGVLWNEKKPLRIGLNTDAQITVTVSARFPRVCNPRIIGLAFHFQKLSLLQIKRFENMTEDLEVGTQDLVPRKLIGIGASNVSGFNPSVPENYDPYGC